jgi:alkylation response protein AidB-like acyl-CoA dehydrogenase
MDFKHTEEQQMLVDTVNRYLQNEYKLADRNVAASSATGFDPKHWAAFAELGLTGVFFKEDDGGFGGTGYDTICVLESLGRALVVEPLADCALIPGQVLASAKDLDRLENVIAGDLRLAVAFDENDARYNRSSCNTTATKTADGWLLNGTKAMVKFASQSDALIVSARTGEQPGQISLFVVPTDASGLKQTSHTQFDGGQVSDIRLDDVAVSGNALVGEQDKAGALINDATAWGILAVCAEALGLMETIKDVTLEYLRTRKQFGTEIGRFQALQHRMAQMLLEIEQARSAVINAAAAMDRPQAERDLMLSAAKYSIGRIGTLVAEETIQMHGGIGMTWEYDIGHFAKRLVMIDHEMGDTDFHLARFMELSAA